MFYDVRTNISSAATQMIHIHIIFPSLPTIYVTFCYINSVTHCYTIVKR